MEDALAWVVDELLFRLIHRDMPRAFSLEHGAVCRSSRTEVSKAELSLPKAVHMTGETASHVVFHKAHVKQHLLRILETSPILTQRPDRHNSRAHFCLSD